MYNEDDARLYALLGQIVQYGGKDASKRRVSHRRRLEKALAANCAVLPIIKLDALHSKGYTKTGRVKDISEAKKYDRSYKEQSVKPAPEIGVKRAGEELKIPYGTLYGRVRPAPLIVIVHNDVLRLAALKFTVELLQPCGLLSKFLGVFKVAAVASVRSVCIRASLSVILSSFRSDPLPNRFSRRVRLTGFTRTDIRVKNVSDSSFCREHFCISLFSGKLEQKSQNA